MLQYICSGEVQLYREGEAIRFSRHHRASIDRIKGITVKVPSSNLQVQLISKIEKCEAKIKEAQAIIKSIAKRKEVKLFNQVKGIEKDASVYANKAIQYNIVNKEGSVYKISGRTLGTDVDSVISMIMSDSELYENYIKPEVDKYEKSIAEPEKLDIPEEIKELLPVESATRKRVARSVK